MAQLHEEVHLVSQYKRGPMFQIDDQRFSTVSLSINFYMGRDEIVQCAGGFKRPVCLK